MEQRAKRLVETFAIMTVALGAIALIAMFAAAPFWLFPAGLAIANFVAMVVTVMVFFPEVK